jgi:hypothetical protein
MVESGQWRIRTNAELRQLYNEFDTVAFIKKARLRWLGHVERMLSERVPKRMIYGKPGGSRRRGKPQLRWMDDVENDLRQMGVRRWRIKVVDRDEWGMLIEEAWVFAGTVAPRSK